MTLHLPLSVQEQDAAVFRYFTREMRGVCNSAQPCAGLPLNTFRTVRGRLVQQGRLTRTLNGRYVPVGELDG